ncbi:hypothetical protein JKY79_02240 [Candidatus Babeliales bacterium]|nr:hypothetical protein [Candidatus Babeliales bacterium]
MNLSFHRIINSLYTKSAWGVFAVSFVMGLFAWHTLHFNTKDVVPSLIIIDAAKQKEFGAFTVKIKTGLFIKNFPSFDMIRNYFLVDCLVWFEMYPDEMMLEKIQKFTFINGRVIQKSSPDIKVENGKMIVTYNVRVEFKSNMQYDRFPLEDHRLTLMITNPFVTPSEMFFEVSSNSFRIADDIFISNWKIRDYYVDSGYVISKLDEEAFKEQSSPVATFSINFQKTGFRKVLIIFLPLFFAIFFSFFSLLMNIRNNIGRYSASISGVTSLIGYRFVIEQMMPNVGYFTLADTLYIILLIFALIIFVFQIFFTRQIETMKRNKNLDGPRLKRALFFNSIVFFLLSLLLIMLIFKVMR